VSPAAKKRLVLITLIVVLIAVFGWVAIRHGSRTRVREFSGVTIKRIDTAARTAEIEFIHPETGRPTRVAGTAVPDCEVLINDQPAALGDLREGDTVTVSVRIHQSYFGYSVEAERIHAFREPGGPTSGPSED
jgi:ribosomal protein L19